MIHTAEPVATFIIRISISDIPSKDTSIDLCKENIETKASANDIFRKVVNFGDVLFLTFIQFAVANVIFVKAYTAMASIIIKGNALPLSFINERTTVPARGKDNNISIIPVNRMANRPCVFD